MLLVCVIGKGFCGWKTIMDPGGGAACAGHQVLVVTFASAPGTPNWGNLLSRVRNSADQPAHNCFDILYVVDGARAWYQGQARASFL